MKHEWKKSKKGRARNRLGAIIREEKKNYLSPLMLLAHNKQPHVIVSGDLGRRKKDQN